jgi:hypothetical protein
MTIDITELRDGDLVIQYTGTNDMETSAIVGTHAMIFVEGGLDKLPTVVHQVGASGLRGTQRDALVPNSRPDEGDAYTQRKRIIRCKRADLAASAADYARLWSTRFQVDFNDERGQFSQNFEDKTRKAWTTPEGMVFIHRRLFGSVGKWRAIKYAARREGYLCYPGEEDYKGKGMHCSMFATLCYQVAGLAAVVTPAPRDARVRVSDKRVWSRDKDWLKDSKLHTTDQMMYGLYLDTLREHDLYGMGSPTPSKPASAHLQFLPGVSLWRGSSPVCSTNFEALITAGMMVDAKVIKATSLYQSLCSDDAGWQDMGDLVGEKTMENPDARFHRIQQHNRDALDAQRGWVKQ